jgi:hypothetical protein
MIEYEGFPSFKLTYCWRTGIDYGLSGFASSDRGNRSSSQSASCNLCLYNSSPQAVLWRSKLQKSTAILKAEEESYSASTAAIKVLYLRNFLEHGI